MTMNAKRCSIVAALALGCASPTFAGWTIDEAAPPGNAQALSMRGAPTIGGMVDVVFQDQPGTAVYFGLALAGSFEATPAGTILLDGPSMRFPLWHGVTDASGVAGFAIPWSGQVVGLGFYGQALLVRPDGTPILTNRSAIVTAGAHAAVSPSSIVVDQVGQHQQLHAFLEQGLVRVEVTGAAQTSFATADASVVGVDAAGVMAFAGIGTALVTATFDGLPAAANVKVDPTAAPEVAAAIGPAGGAVALANGSGVDVPPGALAAGQTISVRQVPQPAGTILPPNSLAVGAAYEFEPDGLTFAKEVRTSLALDPAQVPPGYDADSALVHVLLPGGRFVVDSQSGPPGEEDLVETANQELSVAGKTITARSRHFSCRAAIVAAGLTSVVLDGGNGNTLAVFQRLKQTQPGPGPDGKYGRANCNDDGDTKSNGTPLVDEADEFMCSGGLCPGPCDDVDAMIDTRPATDIRYIVLHCTAGPAGNTFGGETALAASSTWAYWAHYYVGKDGTIVQSSLDTQITQHVKNNNAAGTPGNGINNGNSIGIEIYSNEGVQNYPGRQLSAVVRLCDYLIRRYPNIARPSAADPDGNLITHAEQDEDPTRKTDPINQFRTAVMGSPSIQEVVYRALRANHEGVINAKGGDALGQWTAGNAGDVRFEAGVSALENDYVDSRPSLAVQSGASVPLGAATNLMHVLVEGTLRITADAALDVDGVLYVGPNATIDARGGFDGHNAYELKVASDGFALIEGRVLINGTDKLGPTELPPWNQPPFPAAGSGSGPGGNGQDFEFKTAAPGPLWIPTIVARGGDGSSATSGIILGGGHGGAVTILAHDNGYGDRIAIELEGRANTVAADQHEVGLPDYLPPPPPFNQMTVITPAPLASGTCPADPFATTSYLRPVSSQRLAIGRVIEPVSLAVGANVSPFVRGIVTAGGLGSPQSTTGPNPGSPGGEGGAITITNSSAGRIRCVQDAQLFSGAGVEKLAYVLFTTGCGDFAYFEVPNGGTGGKGGLNGGKGGAGGAAGAIAITGIIAPATAQASLAPTALTPVLGHDNNSPNTSAGLTIGSLLRFGPQNLTTGSVRGSGGSAGGATTGSAGTFGAAGAPGTTTINGSIVFP